MICASLALLQIMFAVHRFAQGAGETSYPLSAVQWSLPAERQLLSYESLTAGNEILCFVQDDVVRRKVSPVMLRGEAAPLLTDEPFSSSPSYCIILLEYKFGGQLWILYGMS